MNEAKNEVDTVGKLVKYLCATEKGAAEVNVAQMTEIVGRLCELTACATNQEAQELWSALQMNGRKRLKASGAWKTLEQV